LLNSVRLQLLRRVLGSALSAIETQTVDKYQGRDKDCIIVSLVRSHPPPSVVPTASNAPSTSTASSATSAVVPSTASTLPSASAASIGSLLLDWRRINVALTRAKRKLIVVGCARTVVASPHLRLCVELCRKRNWVLLFPLSLCHTLWVQM
jgi:DNA replication ATP-dependent helicase Dna2